MGRLTGKVAVITGGGSGIGRATARLFAAEDARVAVLDRDGDSALATVQAISGSGGEAHDWRVDLSQIDSIEGLIADVAAKMGSIDVLVNNAATYVPIDLDKLAYPDWLKVLNTNLTAYFLCARSAARFMRQSGGGSIVNICSVHRVISEPNSGAYAASKGGVAQLTRNLAIELAADNILVNSISPGFIRTAMSVVDGVDGTTTDSFKNYYLQSGRYLVATPRAAGRGGRHGSISRRA